MLFRSELNNMLYFARQEAITTQKVHRLVFKSKTKEILVETENPESESGFEPVSSHYFTTQYQFPDEINIISVTRDKEDLLDNKAKTGYCYVVPHGLVQGLDLKLLRNFNEQESEEIFRIEPFLGNFSLIERAEP